MRTIIFLLFLPNSDHLEILALLTKKNPILVYTFIDKMIIILNNGKNIKIYLQSIQDIINKKELEDYIIRYSTIINTGDIVSIFFTLNLDFSRVKNIIKENDPTLLNKIVSGQV